MLERLKNLEENVALLKRMKNETSVDAVKTNRFDEWALRYGLFESIQIIIDIACHIAGKYNLGTSDTYAECIEKLVRHGYIGADLGRNLVATIGLRNLLIHEYTRLDPEKLYGYLDSVDDFSRFIAQVEPHV